MSWELVVKKNFSAAHFLENYRGKCEKMHGHTFQVDVHVKADRLDKSGIGIEFQILNQFVESVLPDHQVLNDVFDLSPSAENMARYFFNKIKEAYPVSRVLVWESENAAASYTED